MNTASRMESTSTAMKIHISHSTKSLLGPNYIVSERGEIEVKGKGSMKTYWLDEREHRRKLSPILRKQMEIIQPMPMPSRTPSGSPCRRDVLRRGSITCTSAKLSMAIVQQGQPYSPITYEDIPINSPSKRSSAGSSYRGRGNTLYILLNILSNSVMQSFNLVIIHNPILLYSFQSHVQIQLARCD